MPQGPPEPTTPLGRKIDARRRELGLTLRQVADGTGISVEQLRAIRYGETENPRGLTRTALDRTLRWKPGSVDAILDRDADPEPRSDADIADGSPATGENEVIAAIRLVYSGEKAGDDEAIVAAVRRRYGDGPPVSIMSQTKKPLERRWKELSVWLRMDAAEEA